MAEEVEMMYGFTEDNVPVASGLRFGLNQDVRLIKFEWIPNGGKDGAEQEALDIVFKVGESEVGYRQFPITQAYIKGSSNMTNDPKHPDFIAAVKDFQAVMTHILHCYRPIEEIKAKLSRGFKSYKEYCQVLMAALGKDFMNKPLDIFLEYQYILGNKQKTYIQIPKKMRSGKWLVVAEKGEFVKQVAEKYDEATTKALWYVNAEGIEHSIFRNGYFMLSPNATQQLAAGATGGDEPEKESSNIESNTTTEEVPTGEPVSW